MEGPSVRYLSFRSYSFADVDVPDDQGRFQHGMVVGAAENGLLVDFFCKGQVPRVVEYGQLFHCSSLQVYLGKVSKVHVLIRTSQNLPLTWVPAKLKSPTDLWLHPPRLIEVELELDGRVTKEILYSYQIRRIRREIEVEQEVVESTEFATGSCPVPEQYSSTFTESSALWKICRWDLCTAVKNEVFLMYIRNGNAEYLTTERATSSPDLKRSLDRMAPQMVRYLDKGLVWSGEFFTQAPVTVLPYDRSTPAPQTTLVSLPTDLLGEIFRFLDSVDRVRHRSVSAQWDAILQTRAFFTDVWVSLQYRYDIPFQCPVWDSLHAVVLVMTKLLTKSTRWVIVAGNADYCRYENTADALRLISNVAQYFDIPCAGQLNVVISQHRFSTYWISLQDSMNEMADLCTALASVCGALVWKDCVFQARSTRKHLFPVRTGSVQVVSPNLQQDLYEILERNAPETDLDEISSWLTEGNHTKDVQRVLAEFQIPGPRLPAQSTLYRKDELAEKEACELDVRRLTRLTLWALSVQMAESTRGIKRPLDESSDDE